MRGRIIVFIFLLVFIGIPLIAYELKVKFDAPSELQSWKFDPRQASISVVDGLTVINDDGDGNALVTLFLPGRLLAGRRVVLSVESRQDFVPATRKSHGGKFMLLCRSGGKSLWFGPMLPTGRNEWGTLAFEADIPPEAESCTLILGLQGVAGTIRFRNLSVSIGETGTVDLRNVANMGFEDETEGDGKGGWSDQGPRNDAKKFNFRQKRFGNVPFRLIDPAENDGKSVVTFAGKAFPNGVKQIELEMKPSPRPGRWLYVLHTLAYGSKSREAVGQIGVWDGRGRSMTIPVQAGTDVADWWNPVRLPNGFPAGFWSALEGGNVGVYVSRFKLDPNLEDVEKITIRGTEAGPVWIVLGMTLSTAEYAFPADDRLTIVMGDSWRIPAAGAARGIVAGSALDLSGLVSGGEIRDRVIVNREGRLALESDPARPVRFFAASITNNTFHGSKDVKGNIHHAEFTSHESIEEFVRQLRRHGCNMLRIHFLDSALMHRETEDFHFKPEHLDAFDYLVFLCGKNGIYLNIDAMSSRIGYSAGWPWAPPPSDRRRYKTDIYFKAEVRENWRRGFGQLLTRVNPYSGIRLADDPVLALVVAFNEQEFGFRRALDFENAREEWREFLEKRYGTIAKLKESWGEDPKAESFPELPVFTVAEYNSVVLSPKVTDIYRFEFEKQREMFRFYLDTIRETGCRALVTNLNMGLALKETAARRDFDYIAMNGYHAHPFDNTIDVSSSITGAGNVVRRFISSRMYRKPFVVTEHGHAFWNPFRYEQSFITGAYAAFQEFDVLTAFGQTVYIGPEGKAYPFKIFSDPVALAQEWLTAFLFLRGDVSPAPGRVRLLVDSDRIWDDHSFYGGVHSAQSVLGLVTGLSVDPAGSPQAENVNDATVPVSGTSTVVFRAEGYQTVLDSASGRFDPDGFLNTLKQSGKLPTGNRSDFSQAVYESSTGELFMNCPSRFMSVNTPRFQGVCAPANSTVALQDVGIERMTVDGNLSVVSVDGLRPIADARRLVIVFSTNALNSGMSFADSSMAVRIADGTAPVLLKTGAFRISIRNNNAGRLKAWALRSDGVRYAELPLVMANGKAVLSVDTASLPGGAAGYFELSAE